MPSPACFTKRVARGEGARLDAEAECLAALRATACVRVPEVLDRGQDAQGEWMQLEWLALAPLDAESGAKLGEALAALHRIPQAHFGWASDNFIGATPQPNGWSHDWTGFWRERRLAPQLLLAANNGLSHRLIDRGHRLIADCACLLRGHEPTRSLLHGDLWGGNAGSLPEGTPVIFDPATYVGDRETDIAMTKLFGGFPPGFASAYHAAWPLAAGHAQRCNFYNLYHVLNHANLFGGAYATQAERMIDQLIAETA